jgi:hypothetical protein
MYVEELLGKLEPSAIKLSSQDVILGFALHQKKCTLHKDVNNIILHAKYFIWNCRKTMRMYLLDILYLGLKILILLTKV